MGGRGSSSGAKRVDNSGASGYNRYRKTSNIGDFSELKEPMQKRHVREILKDMPLDYDGIEIDIIRDRSLIGKGVYGYTFPDGKRVQLYPDAFANREELVKTLGHERVHCEQIRLFGTAPENNSLGSFESAANFSEQYWWTEYLRRSGYNGDG